MLYIFFGVYSDYSIIHAFYTIYPHSSCAFTLFTKTKFSTDSQNNGKQEQVEKDSTLGSQTQSNLENHSKEIGDSTENTQIKEPSTSQDEAGKISHLNYCRGSSIAFHTLGVGTRVVGHLVCIYLFIYFDF